jgi:hypothetical protein
VRPPANAEEAREVAAWIEARKKAWPTAANVSRKVGGQGAGGEWGAACEPTLGFGGRWHSPLC